MPRHNALPAIGEEHQQPTAELADPLQLVGFERLVWVLVGLMVIAMVIGVVFIVLKEMHLV